VLGLIAFAIWPAVHFVLTQTHGIYPWKLFGWAMYSVPRRYVTIAVEDRTRPRHPTALDLRHELPELEESIRAYQDRRWALGEFAPADDLVAEIFAARPGMRALRLQVRRLELDRASSRYRTKRTDYIYERIDE